MLLTCEILFAEAETQIVKLPNGLDTKPHLDRRDDGPALWSMPSGREIALPHAGTMELDRRDAIPGRRNRRRAKCIANKIT